QLPAGGRRGLEVFGGDRPVQDVPEQLFRLARVDPGQGGGEQAGVVDRAGGAGDAAQVRQGRLRGGRALVPEESLLEPERGAVPVAEAEQVGGGGEAGAYHRPAVFAPGSRHRVLRDRLPPGRQRGVHGGTQLGRGGGADRVGHPGVDLVAG